jgi:NADPH:quinone reductase-like Zn-dependent oxidoreductase
VKALVAPSYGPLDQLAVVDRPKPVPGPGQILVRVEAAALNPLDAALVVGAMREVMPIEHPFVVGMDASGVVEAVGEGVIGYAVGDAVLAYTHFHPGTIAEYTLVTEGSDVAPRPEGLDPVRAAALVSTSLTAECVLDELAGIEAGQPVLVIGATGGVGSFVVQLAAQAGLRVLATAAPADVSYVRGLGASEDIDYTVADPVEEVRRLVPDGAAAVVDLINRGPALTATASAIRPGGRLVSTLMGPQEVGRGVGVTYVRMATRDELAVEVAATYPLADAPEALAEVAAGRYTRGKVVIALSRKIQRTYP